MTTRPPNTIGVGIVGGSIGGWAALGHVPALRALPGYDLRAVSTSRRESAEAAAKEFGAAAAYDSHVELIADTGVDLVVVAVAELTVPEKYFGGAAADVTSPAHNVAQLYAQFARDLAEGTRVAPDFAYALTRHHVIDAVEKASATGVRQRLRATATGEEA
ncbi:Gfo/Idh/MocA family oxidoreductase [Streptomyces sp. NPDC058665]|uniref:Gfo/Idh/MocA family oxidoreductase n=1 Tax=Streptomyces sp. NPDC058665 TaxID=3346586 RepID=UPI00364D7B4F